MTDRAKQLAEDHCDYVVSVFREAYVAAFVHGHKHGLSEARPPEKELAGAEGRGERQGYARGERDALETVRCAARWPDRHPGEEIPDWVRRCLKPSDDVKPTHEPSGNPGELREGSGNDSGRSPKRSSPVPAPDLKWPRSVVFIVNGVSVVLDLRPNAALGTYRDRALKATQNTGHPGKRWLIRREGGETIAPDTLAKDANLREQDTLFLVVAVAAGGAKP